MKPILLSAPWCSNCTILKKTLDLHQINIEVVDTDADATLARQHNVRGLPTILILNDDGTEVERFVGAELKPAEIEKLKVLSI